MSTYRRGVLQWHVALSNDHTVLPESKNAEISFPVHAHASSSHGKWWRWPYQVKRVIAICASKNDIWSVRRHPKRYTGGSDCGYDGRSNGLPIGPIGLYSVSGSELARVDVVGADHHTCILLVGGKNRVEATMHSHGIIACTHRFECSVLSRLPRGVHGKWREDQAGSLLRQHCGTPPLIDRRPAERIRDLVQAMMRAWKNATLHTCVAKGAIGNSRACFS